MPKLHFPEKPSPAPLGLNSSEVRNTLLAVISESLREIEGSMYIVSEYYKRRGIEDGLFTQGEFDEDEEGEIANPASEGGVTGPRLRLNKGDPDVK